jgi:arginine/ornithine succinyltransferase subunit-like protein
MSAPGRFTVREALAADLPLIAAWLVAQAPRPAAPPLPEAAHEHLLVALDDAGTPRATLRLLPRIGLGLPRPSYRVGLVVHAAAELGLFHQQATLLLGHDLTGAAELAEPAHDGTLGAADVAAAWHRLIDAAHARINAARAAFGPRLVVELPGVVDAAGHSPFWQGLGRHFYSGEPTAAQAEHGRAWVWHAAALMPRQPLLAAFLPDAAQAAIGQPGAAALGLHAVLLQRGWRWRQQVRIDDGGPVLEAELAPLG